MTVRSTAASAGSSSTTVCSPLIKLLICTRPHNLAIADAGAGGGDGHTHLLCLAELISYEEACRLNPEIETFDSTLQQRIGRAISTLTDGV
ncbi:hypothetical protein ZIOFF_003060 [Zingiber officinale]|uniref:Uncharacterized protein n=1 Tax=Zingiber officinale TaxID=94328 RepID=A0A8J5I0F0_ZINOF|nr:hypothetical protein ZIOFF_003060 [Zingiber officinale]